MISQLALAHETDQIAPNSRVKLSTSGSGDGDHAKLRCKYVVVVLTIVNSCIGMIYNYRM